MGNVLPSMGYYQEQLDELSETIRGSGAEIVVSGTPINLARVLKIDIPVLHVEYNIRERMGSLEKIIGLFLKNKFK